jgi:hypothetical protein
MKGVEQESERQLPPPTSSSSVKRNDNSKLSEEETSTCLHDTTVMTYLSSMLTTDEAMNIETHLMRQYNEKENEIKLLLNDLYDDKSSDVTHNSKNILSIEAAIAGMADLTDEYTLATAIPRSDFF